MEFKVSKKDTYTLIEFNIDKPITPDVLQDIKPPKVDTTKGVIISGRGPIWLYGYLIHHYHPALWVATFDPRLGGGVVVMSHTPEVSEGDVIK